MYFRDMSGSVAPQQTNLANGAAQQTNLVCVAMQHGAVLYFRDSVVYAQQCCIYATFLSTFVKIRVFPSIFAGTEAL